MRNSIRQSKILVRMENNNPFPALEGEQMQNPPLFSQSRARYWRLGIYFSLSETARLTITRLSYAAFHMQCNAWLRRTYGPYHTLTPCNFHTLLTLHMCLFNYPIHRLRNPVSWPSIIRAAKSPEEESTSYSSCSK